MKYTVIATILTAIASPLLLAEISAPLPNFSTVPKQKRKVSFEQKALLGINESSFFYTGKPYVNEKESYLFKYRDYAANLIRWTSADPSGFPDGANSSFYAPTPTSELDSNGLWKLKLVQLTSPDPMSDWYSGYRVKGGLSSNDGLSVGDTTDATSIQINSYQQIFTTSIFGAQHVWAETTPYFTITVSETGMLSVTTNGEMKQIADDHMDEGIAIAGQQILSPDGHSLTMNLSFEGALTVTGVSGAQVGTGGVNLEWSTTSGSHVFSALSMGFVVEAIE